MNIEDTDLGTNIETNQFTVLFGNRNSNSDTLGKEFPGLRLKRIKQVHGDQVIHTNPHAIDFAREADAHYSNESNIALCISTADCIPVMIFHQSPRWIASIHAGWRGVQNRIVPKTIAQMIRLGCKAEELTVLVGPHIQKPSFEVGNDVRDQLLASLKHADNSLWEKISDTKSLVDLHQILKGQLQECGIDAHHCHYEFKNTVTDLNYHSFRRDKDNSGRQLSFIALK
jgi:polyphenol oxidase